MRKWLKADKERAEKNRLLMMYMKYSAYIILFLCNFYRRFWKACLQITLKKYASSLLALKYLCSLPLPLLPPSCLSGFNLDINLKQSLLLSMEAAFSLYCPEDWAFEASWLGNLRCDITLQSELRKDGSLLIVQKSRHLKSFKCHICQPVPI